MIDIGILAGDIIGDTVTEDIEEVKTLDSTVYSFRNSINILLQSQFSDAFVSIYDLINKKVDEYTLTETFTTKTLNRIQGI